MRLHDVTVMTTSAIALMALCAISVSAPARAQVVTTTVDPEMVITRLMSFDRNNDGRVVSDELPERMHDLVVRGDKTSDGALDRAEVRQLATTPGTQRPILNAQQVSIYGFGDTSFSFDSSSHIDGALDDLRLAAATREKARQISREFLAGAGTRAKAHMMTTMEQLLTGSQLDDFRAALGPRMVTVPVIQADGVTYFGATAEEAAAQKLSTASLRGVSTDLARHIETYGLSPEQKQRALESIRRVTMHTPGRLNEIERVELLEQLRSLLNDEQRDDLRAALERRPIVKLSGRVDIQTIAEFVGRSDVQTRTVVVFGDDSQIVK